MENTATLGIKTFEENYVNEIANPVKKVIARIFVRMMFITALAVTGLLAVRILGIAVLLVCMLTNTYPVIPFLTT